MSIYPRSDGERLVDAAELQSFVKAIFLACGMSPLDADLLSDSLVTADLRGCHSHGVLRVPDYVKKLTLEGVDPQGKPQVVKDHAAALVIDGQNSMGQISCGFAMGQAIDRARETGVAVAAVRGSNHCGAMAYFAMMALQHDMIGVATTNALPTMAPWGASHCIVGINPLAIAIPCDREHPVIFDAAFSASSHGKIRVYHQKGLPIPPGWASDRNGVATTDPVTALDGLLQPIGGYKGVGLAIVMGLLSSMLSGAADGTELGNMTDGPKAGHDGHFLMAIKISAFEATERFKSRMDTVVQQICESERIVEDEPIYAPGGLEADTEQRHLKDGIPLNECSIDGLLTTATERGLRPSEFIHGLM